MKLADSSVCTGCGACAQACPKQAIHFVEDQNGFPVPRIDESACISCGLCSRSCPALCMPKEHPVRNAYAAQAKDKTLLKESTSGALFPVFAQAILKEGGAVCGCVWDEAYNAVFTIAQNEAQLSPMKGSKYVWSRPDGVFPEVAAQLEAGKKVLFAGLPCQAAGLKNYLQKEYENLYLVDFFCSGAPSPLAFHKYLETIAPKGEYAGLDFKFRDKDPYGVGVHITYRGQKKKPSRRGEHIKNPYYYAFYTHLIDRESCYRCPYGSDLRVSDLTLGDYWGIENYHVEMDTKAGVSALLVNTEKGEALVSGVRENLELVLTKKESIAKANNFSLKAKTRNRKIPEIREGFFSQLRENGWEAAEKKYLHSRNRTRERLKLLIPEFAVRAAHKILKR